MEKLLYTKRETARLLSISTAYLDDIRKDGLIQGYTVGKSSPRVYFKADDILNLVERLEVAVC